jgi:ABC-type transport system involved in cytochrome c biogenesis ATPase subunit/GNAT superfamily N-acetyltransferase
MRFCLLLPSKREEETFKIDKEYKSVGQVTKRTTEVSEAFGIGVDEEKKFTVFKNFLVDINPGDILYISGDSGGGKSSLLREIYLQMMHLPMLHEQSWDPIMDSYFVDSIKPDEILVEGVGKDAAEAIKILSLAGLNEAFLMNRKYSELSDGQKYRYRIAKMIDSKHKTWLFDEFCASLDRNTAKVVAFCIQKLARKMGVTAIAATTHTDLAEDLKPTTWVVKKFGAEADVLRKLRWSKNFSLLRHIRVSNGTINDYQKLSEFHYRAGKPRMVKAIFKLTLFGEIIGCIVYGSPHLALRARNYAMPEWKVTGDPKQHAEKINKSIVRIWRVVVLPKYRSVGLGVRLVKQTLAKVGFPIVETLAVMAKYNPFFEHAGMTKVELPERLKDHGWEKVKARLTALGFEMGMISSRTYNLDVLRSLDIEKIKEVANIILAHFIRDKFRGAADLAPLVTQLSLDAMAFALTKKRLDSVYLYWRRGI